MVLVVAGEYLKIIEEIRNLEKGALGDYINQRLNPLQEENKYFVETLYKYILYVLRNVDEPGDNDLAIENGNWPVFDANGEMKLTGYQTRLHDILPTLHNYKTTKISTAKPFKFVEEMKRFENDVLLNINTYTPELRKKLDEINSSIIKERYENYLLPQGLTQQPPEPSAEPTSEPLQTITEKLKNNFRKYGFYELQTIKDLKESSVEKLIVKISENKLPYKIAMLHFLGVVKHLEVQHFKSKDKMYNELGSWFESTKREISGNLRVLNPVSKEDRQRYTADQHTGRVKEDYNKLK